MTSLRPAQFFIIIALTFFSGRVVNAQNSAIDCKAQNQNPGCATTPAHSSSPDLPKVTYLNGQLTITARNSRLGDVLRAVSTQTGAVIEFPADRAEERIFAQTAPGPVRDVLAKLLSGSRFNYVMLGSPNNPNLLQRMILTNSDQPAGIASPEVANQTAPPVVPVQAAGAPADSETSDNLVPAVTPPPLQAANPEHIEAPKEPLSPEALKQLVQERMAARRQQQEPQSNPPQ
jgi:hypothetical protein